MKSFHSRHPGGSGCTVYGRGLGIDFYVYSRNGLEKKLYSQKNDDVLTLVNCVAIVCLIQANLFSKMQSIT